jgi:SAM-dependent MidA family methyltransferase
MLKHHLSQSAGENQPLTPFVVYELGAGTGTVARNVLDFAKVHAPEVYQEMKYITVEISDSLAALQHQQVSRGLGMQTHGITVYLGCRWLCLFSRTLVTLLDLLGV